MSDDPTLALYQTVFCPFCERVRAALRRLNVEIPTRDIDSRLEWRRELMDATGRSTVPCLRIESTDGSVRWMHESADIVDYLEERFGPGSD